jgi:hypothetical protein
MRAAVSIAPMIDAAMRRLAATIALAGALAGISTAASAATRPTLETVGIPSGVIVGHSMPYIETNTVGHLRAGYHGRLPAGAKLQLLVKPSGGSFRALRTQVRLSGGHATVAIAEPGIGGPVGYEVAIVSGGRRLAISKAVSVYWTRPPGGIFVLGATGGGSAYTSLTVASESCASPLPRCKGGYGSGQSFLYTAQSGTSPVPPGWSVALIYNGQQLCSSTAIGGACSAQITFPTVTTGSMQVVVTADVISPHGVTTTANLYVTVFA